MLTRLHEQIAAVCQIVGVSGDQGRIRIDFAPEATAQQRTDADAIVQSFDWSDAAHAAWLAAREPEKRYLEAAAAQAIADNDAYLAIANPTNAQNLAQIRRLTQQNNRIIRRLVKIA